VATIFAENGCRGLAKAMGPQPIEVWCRATVRMAIEPARRSRKPRGISNTRHLSQRPDQPRVRNTGAAAKSDRVGVAAAERAAYVGRTDRA